MKKLIALLTLIGMIGVYTVACGSNNKNSTSDHIDEANKMQEEIKDNETEVKAEVKVEEVKEEKDKDEEAKDEVKEQENVEIVEDVQNEKAEKQLITQYFEAMKNQDVEMLKQCVLYDDLDFPLNPLADMFSYYFDKKLLDLVKVEDISDDMKIIYVLIENKDSNFEDKYLLKKVDDTWYVALQGITAWSRSVYTNDQVEDGKVGIFLRDVYHYYDGKDIYVISIVNNTDELFYFGFVNEGGFIYENNEKGYIKMNNKVTIDPYNKDLVYFTVDSSGGPIKSITMKEVMLGLKAQTEDVEVFIGEMIEK